MESYANIHTAFPTLEGQKEPPEDLVPEFEPEDVAIGNILASLGEDSDASVSIYRQGKGGYRDITFVTETRPTEFSIGRLQHEFGGGTYRIHVKSTGRLIANRELKVADLPNRAPDNGLMLAPVNQKIDQLAGLVQQLAGLIAQPAQQSRKEMIEELLMYKQLFDTGGVRAAPAVDPMDSAMKMIEFAKTMSGVFNGAGEAPDGMAVLMRAMETFGKPLAEAAMRSQAPPASYALTEQQQAALPGPEQQAPSVAPQPQIGEQEAMAQIEYFIKMLLDEAREDADPTGSAYQIVKFAPLETINDLLRPDDWFEKLSVMRPELAPYREWFSDLRDIVFEILTPDEGESTKGEISPGVPPHVSS
jgi:hypothetical protein